jgi:hypothetical protein
LPPYQQHSPCSEPHCPNASPFFCFLCQVALFSCKYLLYLCLRPFFWNGSFFANSSYHNLMFCQNFLFLLFAFLANFLAFGWATSLHFLYFAHYLMFLNHLGKSLRKRGVICSEEKELLKELNISSTPLETQFVISTIIQITLVVVIYNSCKNYGGIPRFALLHHSQDIVNGKKSYPASRHPYYIIFLPLFQLTFRPFGNYYP